MASMGAMKDKAKKCGIKLLKLADFLSPFALLGIRLWIANVFWNSALTKIPDMGNTLYLFEIEYKIHETLPFLPPIVAAYSATFFELVMPVLIVMGLGSRLAALPLLIMTAVIQFTYMESAEHIIWALFLATIILVGPGRFSWDYIIRKKQLGDTEAVSKFSHALAWIFAIALSLLALREIFMVIG